MGPLGWQETIFIFVLALLVFGPKKLPELGKTIGKAMTEFRRASSELKSTWDREMAQVEKETESLKEVTTSYDHQIASSYSDHNSYHDSSYESGYEYGYDAGTASQASTDSPTVSASATEGAELTVQAGESAPVTAAAAPAPQGSPVVKAEPDPNPVRT